MLHNPNTVMPRAAILIVNSRVEYRVGPHRFYVHAARHWAKQGFLVLRLDYPGNGDSDGDALYSHMDSFPIKPALAAVSFLQERSGGLDMVIAGLCMGARNALYVAAASQSVRHLLAFAMPFSDATPDIGRGDETETGTVGKAVARSVLSGYIARLSNMRSWSRFLTGKSDYGVIKRVLPAAAGIGRNRIFKEPVFRSMETLLGRNGEILFSFGSNDVFLPDFRDQFALVKPRLPYEADGCSVEIIENANHTFSRLTWQDAAISNSSTWLERQFPLKQPAS